MIKLQYLLICSTIVFLSCSDEEKDPAITPPPVEPVPTATLTKQWETEAVLKTPESVLWDGDRSMLYISNVNGDPSSKDGNGFISKVTATGAIDELEWVTGLDAPKGMGILAGKLYVADVTNVKVINLETAEIILTIELPGARFLNDIAIDESGTIYISDTGANIIFSIVNDTPASWLNQGMDGPNGLIASDTELFVVEFGSGNFDNINKETKLLATVNSGFTEADGIVRMSDSEWLISSFAGEIYFLNADGKKLLIDTKASGINAADLGYLPDSKTVLVPTFSNNTLVSYKFEIK
jgi:hypothetical protein